jgi:hypothetical protein
MTSVPLIRLVLSGGALAWVRAASADVYGSMRASAT